MRPDQNDFPDHASQPPARTEHDKTRQRYTLTDETSAEASADATQHQQPRRLQVDTPEELLAYVQGTLGFRPTASIVIVAFAERQLSTVIRCDLPDVLHKMLQSDTLESVTFFDFGITETQELQLMDLGEHLGQLIAHESSTTSCLLMYLAAEVSVSDQHALAATGTVNAMLTAQLGLQSVPVEESWLIHHDQLWHLRCAMTTDCEIQGQPLGDPEATELLCVLDPQGKTRRQSQTAIRQLIFPPASQANSLQVSPIQVLLEQRPKVVLNWLQLWDTRLGTGPTMLDSAQVTELLYALEYPTLRETVLGMATFDFDTSIRGMMALGKFPNQLGAISGLRHNMQDGDAVQGCLLGQSERIPNWQRIAALERLCRQLLPLAEQNSGAGAAGMLVWIEWVRGRGSLALDYLRQARKHFPEEQWLIALEQLLRQGRVAAWATRPDSAWTPRHAA